MRKKRNAVDDLLSKLLTGVMGIKSRFGMALLKNAKMSTQKWAKKKLKESYYNPQTGIQ